MKKTPVLPFPPRHTIKQIELENILLLTGQVRRMTKVLNDLSEKILADRAAGVDVEEGSRSLEVIQSFRGGKLVQRLLVH